MAAISGRSIAAKAAPTGMPPVANRRCGRRPEPGTPETRLYTDFLKPRDWLRG